jgi:hypothetical protein
LPLRLNEILSSATRMKHFGKRCGLGNGMLPQN